MGPDIDPAVMAALLGKRQFARRRWRLCWWRVSVLAFTTGFWGMIGWVAAAFLGGRS